MNNTKCNKHIRIHGLNVTLMKNLNNVVIKRRLVEPEWIRLWFLATENQWDEPLWNNISNNNQNWFVYCYHLTHQPQNSKLEVAISQKFKKTQDRLVLLEGMIANGNLNPEIIAEIKQILDSLVDSGQLSTRPATRMMNRIKRTYEAINSTVQKKEGS
jgi:hypothetical protein